MELNKLRYNVILASKSPRRRQLMTMLDIPFEIAETIDVEEIIPENIPNEDAPEYLSRLKAEAYRPNMGPDDMYITADTAVLLGDRILGKPKDAEDARQMLRDMSGHEHRVITGVTIMTQESTSSFSSMSFVKFGELTDEEIEYYVTRYKPFDKAGAYGIQEWIGAAAIRGIEGSFYNIMGLPLNMLYTELKNYL